MTRPPKFHAPLEGDFDSVLSAIANENKPTEQTLSVHPFLKWVGGKRSILPELLKRMPKNYHSYYEPFLGGGALYFAVQPEYAYLSDANFHLIITFKAVRNDVEGLIRFLKVHASRHSKEYYLNARNRLFKEKNPTKIASLLIYLNKTCYNGLYRVNKTGQFNVPIGDYKDPAILDEKNLRNASKLLQGADIYQQDFSQVPIIKNAFYYIDPPYHKTYDGYNENGFGEKEHAELAKFCHEIDKKGGYFLVSNSNTSFVRNIYKGYTIERVSASRFVSCKAHQRGKTNELIIRNYT